MIGGKGTNKHRVVKITCKRRKKMATSENISLKPFELWKKEDVSEWLKTKCNLPQYTKNFEKNEINGNILTHLSNDDLKDMGIDIVGHRKIILYEIEKLSKQQLENCKTKKRKLDTNEEPKLVENVTSEYEKMMQLLLEEERKQEELDYQMALKLQPRECKLCLETKEFDQFQPLVSCEHSFCRDCLREYFVSKILSKDLPILCPLPECKQPITLEDVELNVEKKFVDLWNTFSLETLIEKNPKSYSCCPTPYVCVCKLVY